MCDCLKAVEEERDFTKRCQGAASTETVRAAMDWVLVGYQASIEAMEASQRPPKIVVTTEAP